MGNLLRIKKEVPYECFSKMISSSVITSDDVVSMLGYMVETVKDKDVSGKCIERFLHPVGEWFSNPTVCIININNLHYLRMQSENLLGLDEEVAFVLNNEIGETIVWPILSKYVYVFCTNPFKLETQKWYHFSYGSGLVCEREKFRGEDKRDFPKQKVTQFDKGYRYFRLFEHKIVAQKDFVERTLKWSHHTDNNRSNVKIYDAMWLLRNEPEDMEVDLEMRGAKAVHPILGQPYMGEIDE